jgi:TRAP-type C4-dicarboxylate transport system substrate-binding protein
VDDLQGAKVRAPGRWSPKIYEAAGAVPVSLPAPDVFDALDKGVLQATHAGIDTNLQFKLYEICKYQTIKASYETNTAPMLFIMNFDTYSNLPADVQAAIVEIGSHEIENWGALVKQDVIMGQDLLREQGVELIPFPEDSIKRWKEMTDKLDFPSMWVNEVMKAGVSKETAEAVKDRWIELEPEMIQKYSIDW